MQLVVIESPYAGDVEKNLEYLRYAMHDCLLRGEAPYASHALYTQDGVLNDSVLSERMLGIEAGLAWGAKADKIVVCIDLGISQGMKYGVQNALRLGKPIEYRTFTNYRKRFDVPVSFLFEEAKRLCEE